MQVYVFSLEWSYSFLSCDYCSSRREVLTDTRFTPRDKGQVRGGTEGEIETQQAQPGHCEGQTETDLALHRGQTDPTTVREQGKQRCTFLLSYEKYKSITPNVYKSAQSFSLQKKQQLTVLL